MIDVKKVQGMIGAEKDGEWGPLTQSAMDSYQRAQGVNAPPWLLVAERELGVHEIAGPKATQRIIEYDKHTTLKATSDEVAWCSSFANFCVDVGGGFGTHSAAAASWLDWGKKVQFRYGCICVFSRTGGNHVSFGVFQDNDSLAILGGNQSDSVCVHIVSKQHLLSIRWPN